MPRWTKMLGFDVMGSANICVGQSLFDRSENGGAIRKLAHREVKMGIKLSIHALLGFGLAIAAPVHAQSIYLHSPSEQQATEDLVTNLEAARDAHIAALDRHDAALEAAAQREQTAIVRRALARRDVVVARHLEGDAETLGATLGVRLQLLTHSGAGGGVGLEPLEQLVYTSPQEEARFLSNLDVVRKRRLELDRRQSELRLATARGALPDNCQLTMLRTPDESASLDQNECLTARRAYEQLIKLISCDDRAILKSTLAAVAGVENCWKDNTIQPLRQAGELGNALKQRRDLGQALERQNDAAKLVRDELAKLEQHFACEQANAAKPGATERISKVAGQIDVLLAFVTQLGLPSPPGTQPNGTSPPVTQEQAAAANAQSLERCEVTNSEGKVAAAAPPVSLSTLVRDLQNTVSVSADFQPARGIWASAAEAAQDFRATKLGEILQAVATPNEESDDRAGTIIRALVRTATPIEMLAQVRAGTLPDTSAILVALAEARMRAATAALEAGRLKRLEALAEQRIVALTNEIAFARMAMGAGANSDRALVLYTTSIERGQIPSDVLAMRMNVVEYDVWSKRERAAVEAAYAMLAAAAAELKTYGEGGIRPDLVARFLNVAGLAAIAESN